MQSLLDFKDLKVNEALEILRTDKKIGQSLDAELEILISENDSLFTILKRRELDLAELFIVSKVSVIEGKEYEKVAVRAKHAKGQRCPRSWRWVPELVLVEPWGKVSPRCAEVLAKLA